MARPRKPTTVLETSGAAKQNPDRMKERENEPQPAGAVGKPPDNLNDTERAIWSEVASTIPAGVLGDTDRIALERLCRLVYQARYEPDDFTSAREKDLISYLGRFGMTPSDRAKIAIPSQSDTSQWDDL